MSDVVELGLLFSAAEKKNAFEFAENTEEPKHQEVLLFIAEQLAAWREHVARLSGSAPLPNNDQNLNVVVRR